MGRLRRLGGRALLLGLREAAEQFPVAGGSHPAGSGMCALLASMAKVGYLPKEACKLEAGQQGPHIALIL